MDQLILDKIIGKEEAYSPMLEILENLDNPTPLFLGRVVTTSKQQMGREQDVRVCPTSQFCKGTCNNHLVNIHVSLVFVASWNEQNLDKILLYDFITKSLRINGICE